MAEGQSVTVVHLLHPNQNNHPPVEARARKGNKPSYVQFPKSSPIHPTFQNLLLRPKKKQFPVPPVLFRVEYPEPNKTKTGRT